MAYQHGTRVLEQATSITAPIEGTAGLQVVFGTAPVNMAKDPYNVTNKPVLAYSWSEAVEKLGYSAEKDEEGHFLYSLCASMYASFQLVGVAPVVFVNVLDPKTHRKSNAPTSAPVAEGEATVPLTGVLSDTVKVQVGGAGEDGEALDPKTASICPLDQGWKGKKYSDLVGAGVKILADGSVVGAIPYVKDYTQMTEGKQEGYFVPVHLGETYKGKTVKCKHGETESTATDTDWVVCISKEETTTATVTFTVDEEPEIPALTLTFGKATFLPEGTALNLAEGTDYVLSYNDDGQLLVTLLGQELPGYVNVQSTSIDPTQIEAEDVIGASAGGEEKGMEVLRQVYPKFGMTPGLLIAPGWSQIPDVAMVLQAKCEEINGYFSCECFVDLNSYSEGCADYTDVKTWKEKSGVNSKHAMALWPCVASGSLKFWYSALAAAVQAYVDAGNDDVPNLSVSNKLTSITATVLADATVTVDDQGVATWDKEVILDQLQANVVNGYGVTTALNNNGWRTWGNRSACYPSITDPKDAWFCVRRYFSWWGNSFILTFAQKVDDPANPRLIQDIVDTENLRGAALVSAGKCAATSVEYLDSENPITDLLNGKLQFHTHLAPYIPAEDIVDMLEFDPDALQSALSGGE